MVIDFDKGNGLVPAIVQDAVTGKILMLGYMNREAYELTEEKGLVTFFSRSRGELWTKGETSGNFLTVKEIFADCDMDTILVKAEPSGPVCHTGAVSCFGTDEDEGFIRELQEVIRKRKTERPEGSYTVRLFDKGVNKIAQKVGEEAVELIIESKDDDRELFLGEAADLMYHYLVLLVEKGCSLADVAEVLKTRHSR